jgi:hypothetical protein
MMQDCVSKYTMLYDTIFCEMMKSLRGQKYAVKISIFLVFVWCDYLICTDSYVYAGVCVCNRSHQHDANLHVSDRQKCLLFEGWSRQIQIPTLPAKFKDKGGDR